jgi:hypothetical protein
VTALIQVTAQLLLLIRDVNDKINVVILLFCVEDKKGTADEVLYERLSRTVEICKLSRNKLLSVTTGILWNMIDRIIGI